MRFSLRTATSQSYFFLHSYRLATTLIALCALTVNFLFASGHNLQRCVELATLCVMAFMFIVRVVRGQLPTVSTTTGILFLMFLVLGLASSAVAYSLRHAIFEWSSILLLLMLIFAVASELACDARILPSVIYWIGIACGLYALRLLMMYFLALASGFQVDMHELAVGFSNARFLNHTQTALLPLIVLLCLKAPHGSGWRKAWFALSAFWWALLFVCEARASVVALGIGCLCAFLARRSQARPFMVAMLWTALAGCAVYALLFILLPVLVGLQPVGSPLNVVARTAANPTSSRNLLWKLALELITAHPWLGVGPQHFAHEGARLYSGAHPHNWLLQIGAEWGIPALLCLLCAVFLGARALVRSGARIAATDVESQHMLVTLLVACTAIFVDGLLSGVVVMPQSQLAIMLTLGIACAWVRMQKDSVEQAKPIGSIASRALMIGVVAAGLCGLIWSVGPDIVSHARGDAFTPAEQAKNPDAHWARMWEAGYF